MSKHNKENNDNASDSKLTEQDLATISSRIDDAVKTSASIAADTTSNAIQKMQETLETMFEKMLIEKQNLTVCRK